MIEIVIAILALVGALFGLFAGLGLVRLNGVLNRMHASTKAGTLGSALTLAAAALYFREAGTTVHVIAIILFLLFTAPLAAHMIGRAAARSLKTGRPSPLD